MRIVLGDILILFCILSDVGGLLCRLCNLSLAFHGCLLDLGTCKTKPGQYCIEEEYYRGGMYWYSIKGCTEHNDECFRRAKSHYKTLSTHCCNYPLCNI